MARISVSRLTKQFGENPIIRGLDLDVAEGEFVTLLGPSGCGKTTTLRCIAGLERPDAGRITIGDVAVFDSDARRVVPPERRGVGMMFQSYALWPHMSIGANVAYPLRRQGVARSEITGRVREALRVVDLAGYEDRKIGSLSGGQQQRVALARTIVGEPRVLLFDEPLSNLDAGLRESMRSEIRRVHDRIGTTCIYVTHDQTEAITLSDRVVVMRNGQIEQVGTPREIFERPVNRFVADFVGVENFLPGTVYSAVPGRSSIRLDGTSTVIDVPTAEADQPSEYPALLAFRSRSAALAGAAGNSPAALNGRVTQRVYLGDEYQFTIQTDAGTVALRARGGIDAPETLAGEGDRVAITLDPHRVVVLARD